MANSGIMLQSRSFGSSIAVYEQNSAPDKASGRNALGCKYGVGASCLFFALPWVVGRSGLELIQNRREEANAS